MESKINSFPNTFVIKVYNNNISLQLALKKYKNRTISLSPDTKISITDLNSNCTIHAKVNIVISIRPDRLSMYVWMLILFYIIFLILLLNFLTRSESAVFTAAILNSALPVTGIVWSIWKLNVTDGVGRCFCYVYTNLSYA